jgi:regulator of nucleoside diphosphate kinase
VATMPPPDIVLSASDRSRLEQLARVATDEGDTDALFLLGEINRAENVPDDAGDPESIVTMGSWVTYWTNWGFPRDTRQLVYPDQYTSDRHHISVLSPLGAALIGLRVGDQMPFFAAGCMNVVRVASVDRSEPNVVPLFRAPVIVNDDPNGDPSPTAA